MIPGACRTGTGYTESLLLCVRRARVADSRDWNTEQGTRNREEGRKAEDSCIFTFFPVPCSLYPFWPLHLCSQAH